jgi:hypothetical protein
MVALPGLFLGRSGVLLSLESWMLGERGYGVLVN